MSNYRLFQINNKFMINLIPFMQVSHMINYYNILHNVRNGKLVTKLSKYELKQQGCNLGKVSTRSSGLLQSENISQCVSTHSYIVIYISSFTVAESWVSCTGSGGSCLVAHAISDRCSCQLAIYFHPEEDQSIWLKYRQA